jgi:hypothetical protein
MPTLKYIFKNEDNLDLTYNTQLDSFLSKYNGVNGFAYRGTFMKDKITRLPKHSKTFYIINYDTSEKAGSHWVCLMKNNKSIFYFDSFGIYPLQKVLVTYKTHNVYYHSTPLQKTSSNICGHLCVEFIEYMLKNGANLKAYNDFLEQAKKYSNRYKMNN